MAASDGFSARVRAPSKLYIGVSTLKEERR